MALAQPLGESGARSRLTPFPLSALYLPSTHRSVAERGWGFEGHCLLPLPAGRRATGSLLKTVSEAADGHQPLRRLRVVFDLLTQEPDVATKRAAAFLAYHAPCSLDQVLLGDGLAGALRQARQHPELGRRQSQ